MSRRYPGFTRLEHMITAGELEDMEEKLEDFEVAIELAYSSTSLAAKSVSRAKSSIQDLRAYLCTKAIDELTESPRAEVRAMYYPVRPPPQKE